MEKKVSGKINTSLACSFSILAVSEYLLLSSMHHNALFCPQNITMEFCDVLHNLINALEKGQETPL